MADVGGWLPPQSTAHRPVSADSRQEGDHGGTMALAGTRRQLPVLALDVCEAFMTAAGKDIGDIRTHAAADSGEIVRIVLRLHGQHTEPAIRGRCLDLVDRLLLNRAHGIEQGLEEHDQ